MKWPSVSERRCSGTLGMEWDSKRISKRNSGTASREHTRSEYRMKKWVNCTHLEPPASGFTVLPPRASNGSASVSCSFQFPPFARIQLTHFRKLGIRNVVNHWSTGEGNVVNWTLGDNGERTQDCAPSFSRLVQLSPYCSVTSLTFSLSYCSTAQFSLFPSLRNQ